MPRVIEGLIYTVELDILNEIVEVKVEYDIHPGYPQTRTDPAEPASIEVVSAQFVDGKIMPDWLEDVVLEYVYNNYADKMLDIENPYDGYPDRSDE